MSRQVLDQQQPQTRLPVPRSQPVPPYPNLHRVSARRPSRRRCLDAKSLTVGIRRRAGPNPLGRWPKPTQRVSTGASARRCGSSGCHPRPPGWRSGVRDPRCRSRAGAQALPRHHQHPGLGAYSCEAPPEPESPCVHRAHQVRTIQKRSQSYLAARPIRSSRARRGRSRGLEQGGPVAGPLAGLPGWTRGGPKQSMVRFHPRLAF